MKPNNKNERDQEELGPTQPWSENYKLWLTEAQPLADSYSWGTLVFTEKGGK